VAVHEDTRAASPTRDRVFRSGRTATQSWT